MKKIALALMLITTIPTYAGTTMCVANDTVAVVLDPSIDSTGNINQNYYDSQTMTCWAPYPYGILQGEYACTDSSVEKPVRGEKSGGICWHRMTHPALSVWTYVVNYGRLNSCTDFCGNRLRSDATLRNNLFHSISN